MSTWATKRKYSIVSTILLIILIPTAFIIYKINDKPATCFDKKQNQGEAGIDCGGPCSLVCSTEAADVLISWQRLLKVDNGVYTAVAYIQNPNLSAGAKNVPYSFKAYDKDGVLVYERRGKTDITPKNVFAVIEPGILTGEVEPAQLTFEFTAVPVWQKQSEVTLPLVVSDKIITKEDSSPRIEAQIKNISVKAVKNVTVIALAYDIDDNALGASKTIVDKIEGGDTSPVIFTWPHPFEKKVSRIEIVPSL